MSIDISLIEGQSLGIGSIITTGDLPEAGEARFDGEDFDGSIAEVFFDLFLNDGAGTDNAQVAFEDIPKLREFIKGRFSEEFPDGGDARIDF